MDLVLVLEHRFRKGPDNNIYSSSNSINKTLWERYLKVFDKLLVVARVQEVNISISSNYLVEHNNVMFIELPYYVGPIQYLQNYFTIKKVLRSTIKNKNAYICRLPSINGGGLIKYLHKRHIPFGVEVVGDPWDVFAPGVLKRRFAFIHRIRSTIALRRLVKKASAAIYVTQSKLQSRYPTSTNAYSTYASNVMIEKSYYSLSGKVFNKNYLKDVINLLCIGSLFQMYKSPDVVILAISILKEKGINVSLNWLGDGQFLQPMKTLASKLGLSKEIYFLGNVSSNEVEKQLMNTDLYIHVAKTEGLPRSLIEAMAKGLPCIGSKVGGIPELLNSISLIDEINAVNLADKIIEFVSNKKLINDQANYNLLESNKYCNDILSRRREKFYQKLKSISLNPQI